MDAVTDSGPLTHLWQADLWITLEIFSQLILPNTVKKEVLQHVVWENLSQHVSVEIVDPTLNRVTALRQQFPYLQLTDIDVLALAKENKHDIVLTDDLALRKALENQGQTPMGSVGIILRAYKTGLLNDAELDQSIDKLFVQTTLYLSPQFKKYVKRLIEQSRA